MPRIQSTSPDYRPENDVIAWFAEMIMAVDRGNFEQAAQSQRQLRRLGWRVDRHDARQTAQGGRGGQ
jgi:hypothetical protein